MSTSDRPPNTPQSVAATAAAADSLDDDVVFDRMWQRVLNDFGDDDAHRKLLDYSLAAKRLDRAAKHYRERRDALGDEIDEMVDQQIEQRLKAIAALALSSLDSRSELRNPPLLWGRYAVRIAAAIVLAGTLWAVFHMLTL